MIALIILTLFNNQCSSWPRIKLTKQDSWHTLQHNGKERRYLIHKPDPYKKSTTLLLVLHGGGGKIESILRGTKGRFNTLADKHRFMVVYPEGYGKHWNDGRGDLLSDAHKNKHDDVGFIRKLISVLKARFYINANRIYATGISNGGMMSQRLACEAPEIKAVASVVSQMPKDLKPLCKPTHPVSVILINGTKDPLVPYNGGMVTIKIIRERQRGTVLSTDDTIQFWRKFNQCGDQAIKTNLPDLDPKDSSKVIRKNWQVCAQNSKVSLLRIEGGGHTWPGGWSFFGERVVGSTNRDFNATDVIWQFFNSL